MGTCLAPNPGLLASGAELPNGLHQALNIFRWCELRYAMTQVKDMANTRLKLPKTLNGSGHLGSNVVGMAQQDSRVEVALDGTL